jgi:cyclic pyranopterin phosphate synthase
MNLTHLDEHGNARMVDVSQKQVTLREAVAFCSVTMKPDTLKMILDGNIPKGDVLSTARIAGIMAAKRTWELIPMCHQVPLDAVKLELVHDFEKSCVNITATARCSWKTGVEMDALTAASIAGLTIYDMCKAVDKEMVVGEIKLLKKTGGKSGVYIRNPELDK